MLIPQANTKMSANLPLIDSHPLRQKKLCTIAQVTAAFRPRRCSEAARLLVVVVSCARVRGAISKGLLVECPCFAGDPLPSRFFEGVGSTGWALSVRLRVASNRPA